MFLIRSFWQQAGLWRCKFDSLARGVIQFNLHMIADQTRHFQGLIKSALLEAFMMHGA